MSAGMAYQCVGGPLDGDDYVTQVEGGFLVRQAGWTGEYKTDVLVTQGRAYDVLLWVEDAQLEDEGD